MMFTSASFLLTEQCNLACRYCFEKGRVRCVSMNTEVAFRALKFLCENAVKSGKKEIKVLLFGGEPLLNFNVCEFVLKKGLEMTQQHGLEFRPQLITNATVMSDRIELMLRRYAARIPQFTCQLSIDGGPQAHDLYRVYADGRGSFERVAANVPVFKEIFGSRLCIHGCVNRRTLPLLAESYRYIMDNWAPARVWFMPVHTEEWQREDVALYDAQLAVIFDEMLRRGRIDTFSPIDRLLCGRDVHPEKTCGAGVDFCTVNGKGEIFPCHSIYFNDDERATLLGDVYRGIVYPERLKPFEEYSVADLGCSDCPNTKCYRCIADNLASNGSIVEQVGRPIRCAMSDVERKWQRKALEIAAECRPLRKATQLDRIEGRLQQLVGILHDGLGGDAIGA